MLRVRLTFVQTILLHQRLVPRSIRLTLIQTRFIEEGGEGEGGLRWRLDLLLLGGLGLLLRLQVGGGVVETDLFVLGAEVGVEEVVELEGATLGLDDLRGEGRTLERISPE